MFSVHFFSFKLPFAVTFKCEVLDNQINIIPIFSLYYSSIFIMNVNVSNIYGLTFGGVLLSK